MQALPVLGTIEVPSSSQSPQYRGISRRRTPSERLIDECWCCGDVDSTIAAVVEHLSQGGNKLALANRVGMVVLRSLPGYSGPQKPLKSYDGRIPLSSFVALKAKQERIDMCRERKVIRSHETLASELIAPGDEDYDVLTHIANAQQTGSSSESQERALIVDSFLETLTPREQRRLGSATVLSKAERWARLELPEAPRRHVTRCKCNGCVKNPTSLKIVARMLERHSAFMTTYALGLRRRPVAHCTLESDFHYYYPALPE
jgi:hypothetical protein